MAPPFIYSSCTALPSNLWGLGQHFMSPWKLKNSQKSQTYVSIPGCQTKWQHLLGRLKQLLNKTHTPLLNASNFEPDTPLSATDTLMSISDELPAFSEDINDFDDILPDSVNCSPDPSSQFTMSKNMASACQSDSWKRVISNIVGGYLEYLTKTLGKPMTSPTSTISCCNQSCESRKFTLLCLFFDCKLLLHVSQFKRSEERRVGKECA